MSKFIFKSMNPILSNNPLSLRWLSSSSVSVSPNEPSFTVSYLISSLGFSLEASEAISKRVSFRTRAKPDKVVDFLRNFGFSQSQILGIVRALPRILMMDSERTILPKLEFLESKGISRPEIAKSLSVFPTLLSCSLDNQIIPTFECLKVLLPLEAKLFRAICQCPDILVKDLDKYVSPNVSTLRSHGVPDSNIVRFFYYWPRFLLNSPVRFGEAVEEVAELGFNPASLNFLVAVCAKMGKSNWESRFRHYKKLGLSEDAISRAFLKYPWCMISSEDKITSVMDFLVSEVGLKPVELAERPKVFNFCLKKRIVPRVRVVQALWSKGLMKKQVNILPMLYIVEKDFLRRYVTRYSNEAPELLKLYNDEKIGSFERTIGN